MGKDDSPKRVDLDTNNNLLHEMIKLGVDPSYWAPFSLTKRQWLETVEKYSWHTKPRFLGKEIYESKGGVYLMSPIVLAQQLSSQNVHGHYFVLKPAPESKRNGAIEEAAPKPPRDQVVIIGRQTGYEVLNTYLRLRDSEWRKPDGDGALQTVRSARIDVVTPNKSTLDSFIQREIKKDGIVHTYNHLEECAEKSPAFGNYDGVIAFERLPSETEHQLRR